MALRQYILAGLPSPVFINETDALEYILPGVYVNETSSAPTTGSLFLPSPLSLGSGGPFFSDRLAS